MPWPDEETPAAHEGLDPPPVLWDLLEMVLDGDGLSVGRERARGGMRDDRVRRRQRARRVGDRIEGTWPPDDELKDLRDGPRIDQPKHDGRGRGHPSPGEAPRTKQKERQDPPEEAVPVQ